MARHRASVREVVGRSHLFDGLSGEELAKVVELCREEKYAAGQTVFDEGSVPRDFYIVKKGKVALAANFAARPGSWKRGAVDVATPYQALAWSAIAGSEKLSLSGRAVEDTELLAIDGASFRALLEQDHQMGHVVMRRMVLMASSRLENAK